MEPIQDDTFTCEQCGGTFPKAWTDDEAEAESVATFGELPADELAVVCDDCYRLMFFGGVG